MNKILAVLMSLSLLACSGGDHDDLRQWMAEASEGLKGRIPDLPQVKPYEPAPYDVGNLLDPFKPGKIGPDQRRAAAVACNPIWNVHANRSRHIR